MKGVLLGEMTDEPLIDLDDREGFVLVFVFVVVVVVVVVQVLARLQPPKSPQTQTIPNPSHNRPKITNSPGYPGCGRYHG